MTTRDTLSRGDTMLSSMFSGRMDVEKDEEGYHLVDRNGAYFAYILDFLRDSKIVLPQDQAEIKKILKEANFFAVQELIEACHESLNKLRPPKEEPIAPVCQVPIVTSPFEEQKLIEQSLKPVVKLLYNRGNNKYSYTSSSDDHMLRNIELFDKLALNFTDRIRFIRDVVGEDICVWSFYGHGRKISEICCTSIVYATEKKQTKVEFPEARIYEETLNVLLYEGSRRPQIVELEKDASSGEFVPRVRRIHAGSNGNSGNAQQQLGNR